MFENSGPGMWGGGGSGGRHLAGGRGEGRIHIWRPHVAKSPLEHTILRFYKNHYIISISRSRSGGNAVEILAARPRPRLFEIRKLSSITRFDSNKIIKIFLLEGFFHLPPASLTPVANNGNNIRLQTP